MLSGVKEAQESSCVECELWGIVVIAALLVVVMLREPFSDEGFEAVFCDVGEGHVRCSP